MSRLLNKKAKLYYRRLKYGLLVLFAVTVTLLLWIPFYVLSKVFPNTFVVTGTQVYVKYKGKLALGVGFGW